MTESRDAFAELLATLGEVGDRYAGDEWGLSDPSDVAEALRVIVHHLGTGIETQFEDDPAHPAFRAIVTPWRKALGDNADARYHDARVHPAGTYYRVRGRTAGAVYVSFSAEDGAEDGAFPAGTVGVLNDTGFAVADDGAFEITLGGPPRESAWLPLAADASRLTVRHYWEDADTPARPPAPDLGLAIDHPRGPRPRRGRRRVQHGALPARARRHDHPGGRPPRPRRPQLDLDRGPTLRAGVLAVDAARGPHRHPRTEVVPVDSLALA